MVDFCGTPVTNLIYKASLGVSFPLHKPYIQLNVREYLHFGYLKCLVNYDAIFCQKLDIQNEMGFSGFAGLL